HLPIAFRLRIVVLLLLGAALAALRLEVFRTGFISTATCAILGSLFMFRLIVYLYDLRHRAAPFSPASAIAYFFMLPSACFPLFPLVDYKSFCTKHFNEEPLRIYVRGLQWMLRGVFQLLLYRLACQILVVSVEAVTDLGGVARLMVATYLLYLR